MGDHPLLRHLIDAAEGRFPPVDGLVEVLAPDDSGTWAVVEFTGHAFVLGDVDPQDLRQLGADGFGGAGHPDIQRFLAGPGGWIGCHDAVLARRTGLDRPAQSESAQSLRVLTDMDHHPRVLRARQHRQAITVYGNDDGLAVVGRGLAGRTEMSVELLDPSQGGAGSGRRLILATLSVMPPGDWCFAQVSPGNAASLRAFLACDFTPIGSEVLIHPS